MLNIRTYYITSHCYPGNLQRLSCKHAFSIRVVKSVDLDGIASLEVNISGSTSTVFFNKHGMISLSP